MQKRNTQAIPGIYDISVIDLILIDHKFIKVCIDTFLDPELDKFKKLLLAKSFLNAVSIHSSVEKKAIYFPLKDHIALQNSIQEAQVEHGKIDKKVKSLKIKISRTRLIKDVVEAELKALAELIKQHLTEEEGVLLPMIKNNLSVTEFNNLGRQYLKIRKFTTEEIKDYPQQQDDLIQWKDSIQKVSNEFLIKMDKFMENLQH